MPDETYKLLRVTGSDAGEFLQGQLTQDMERIAQTGSLPAAWCNPQGRVITLLRVLVIDGGYGLALPASLAEFVCERLAIYRLRADVGLHVEGPHWMHLVFQSDDDLADLAQLGLKPEQEINASCIAHGLIAINIGIEEPCVELMGFEAEFSKAGIDTDKHADLVYLSGSKIRAGIPEVLENTSEKYTPHMLNLDLLDAISFDKGCYTGQEVVARTENLGRSKRRVMRYRTDAEVQSGAKLSNGKSDVGEVINVSGMDLLAVTPVELHDRTLAVDGVTVTPMALPYAVPDS
ncbi:MAG: YgfZ/GcvT domain-containing protein [Woeseiaceae bacterium]